MTDQGPTPVQHCEECGYEVTGLGDSGGAGECPECGRHFHTLVPFIAGKPIRWVREFVRMCGPAVAAAITLLVLAKVMRIWVGAGMLLPAMFLVWVGLAFGIPAAVAREVGERSWARQQRPVRVVGLAVAGIAVNIVLLLVVAAVIGSI